MAEYIDRENYCKNICRCLREKCDKDKCPLWAAPAIDPETLPIVQRLRAELARATAEKDAAVKSRAKLAEYELTVCEEFCYGDSRHDIPPCGWFIDGECALREWEKAND